MGIREDVGGILNELLERAPGDVTGAALLRPDGLMIASVLSQDTDEKRLAAMGAAIVGTSQRTCDELSRGNLNEIIIEGSTGKATFSFAGNKGILAVLSPKEVNLGLVLMEIERTSTSIAKAME
ncbi:roadblock/LC7 domain-containing protein [Methanobacterium paludis]|uniref:Roadblock/LC7 family protein n=1 Tax=Methanobacterium paludis (strain DSM 25820 / JCM 18151 / SWAN1) TaxID=868131 RepID=F6D7X7_METPW|nr:roadblock/LC7 domain-containing protein [Methanobacterium paludis]AEG18498.1 Roadblock/LC7 family protein [Methanobacterium paludis]AEG18500.1 Roadblock/LC7 family protein [Methanobacterium paludis]